MIKPPVVVPATVIDAVAWPAASPNVTAVPSDPAAETLIDPALALLVPVLVTETVLEPVGQVAPTSP